MGWVYFLAIATEREATQSIGPLTRHSFRVRHAQILARVPTHFSSPDAFTRQNMRTVALNPEPVYLSVIDVLKTDWLKVSYRDNRLVSQEYKFPYILLTFIFCLPVWPSICRQTKLKRKSGWLMFVVHTFRQVFERNQKKIFDEEI